MRRLRLLADQAILKLAASDLAANATARRGLPGSFTISSQMSVQRPQRKRKQLSK